MNGVENFLGVEGIAVPPSILAILGAALMFALMAGIWLTPRRR